MFSSLFSPSPPAVSIRTSPLERLTSAAPLALSQCLSFLTLRERVLSGRVAHQWRTASFEAVDGADAHLTLGPQESFARIPTHWRQRLRSVYVTSPDDTLQPQGASVIPLPALPAGALSDVPSLTALRLHNIDANALNSNLFGLAPAAFVDDGGDGPEVSPSGGIHSGYRRCILRHLAVNQMEQTRGAATFLTTRLTRLESLKLETFRCCTAEFIDVSLRGLPHLQSLVLGERAHISGTSHYDVCAYHRQHGPAAVHADSARIFAALAFSHLRQLHLGFHVHLTHALPSTLLDVSLKLWATEDMLRHFQPCAGSVRRLEIEVGRTYANANLDAVQIEVARLFDVIAREFTQLEYCHYRTEKPNAAIMHHRLHTMLYHSRLGLRLTQVALMPDDTGAQAPREITLQRPRIPPPPLTSIPERPLFPATTARLASPAHRAAPLFFPPSLLHLVYDLQFSTTTASGDLDATCKELIEAARGVPAGAGAGGKGSTGMRLRKLDVMVLLPTPSPSSTSPPASLHPLYSCLASSQPFLCDFSLKIFTRSEENVPPSDAGLAGLEQLAHCPRLSKLSLRHMDSRWLSSGFSKAICAISTLTHLQLAAKEAALEGLLPLLGAQSKSLRRLDVVDEHYVSKDGCREMWKKSQKGWTPAAATVTNGAPGGTALHHAAIPSVTSSQSSSTSTSPPPNGRLLLEILSGPALQHLQVKWNDVVVRAKPARRNTNQQNGYPGALQSGAGGQDDSMASEDDKSGCAIQ